MARGEYKSSTHVAAEMVSKNKHPCRGLGYSPSAESGPETSGGCTALSLYDGQAAAMVLIHQGLSAGFSRVNK